MTGKTFSRGVEAALLGVALSSPVVPASADIRDYQFQLVQQEAKAGDALIAVRVIDKRNSKPVTDAVIFAKRLDMAPEAMEEMATKLEQAPSIEPGVYRFKANLGKEGRWRLSLAAKLQGETGTLEDQLILQVTK